MTMTHRRPSSVLALFGAFLLFAGAALFGPAAFAQEDEGGEDVQTAEAMTIPAEQSQTIAAGESADFPIEGFCMDYTFPFPEEVEDPTDVAEEKVRRLLRTAVVQGLAQTEILQTQLALWYTIEGDWGYSQDDVDHSVAMQLVEDAEEGTAEPILPRGEPIDALLARGEVSVEVVEWAATDAEKVFESDAPYHGAGVVRVTNLGDEEIEVYYPNALVVQASVEGHQNMATIAVEAVTIQPSLPNTGAALPWSWLLAAAGALLAFGGAALRRAEARATR